MKAHQEKIYFLAYIWAPVFALLLVIGTDFMAQRDMAVQAKTYEAGNSHLLDLLAQGRQDADISMVVLGNSRLRHALTVGFDPEIPVMLPDGRKLAIAQYGIDGAGFFNFSGMAEKIIAAKPDYLVVMPNVLSNRRAERSFMMDKAATVAMYLDRAGQKRDAKMAWLYERTYIVDQCFTDFAAKRMEQHLGLLSQRDRHSLTNNDSYDEALTFLKNAHDAGIEVVMLDLEPNMEMLGKLGVAPHEVDYPGLGHSPSCKELLKDQYKNVGWLSYYPIEEGRHFCDFIHLNEEGRQEFTNWFLNLLARDFRTEGLCPVPTSL